MASVAPPYQRNGRNDFLPLFKKKEEKSCKIPPPPNKVLHHDKYNLYSTFATLGFLIWGGK
jgi:hypothetical protein